MNIHFYCVVNNLERVSLPTDALISNNNVNKEIYIIMMMSDRSGCANRLQHDLYTLEITKIKLITMRTKLS